MEVPPLVNVAPVGALDHHGAARLEGDVRPLAVFALSGGGDCGRLLERHGRNWFRQSETSGQWPHILSAAKAVYFDS